MVSPGCDARQKENKGKHEEHKEEDLGDASG